MSAPTPTPPWFASTLAALMERRNLDGVRMCELMHGVVGGACDESATTALLVALGMKGETADELATAAAVLREYMVPFHAGRDDLLDTCGTGGDGTGTFNISTATALVAAGAGVPVVKHGNRAASGRTGSADVLAALGVTLEGDAHSARRCLDAVGMAFCFAPHFHPALQRVAGVRRRLGVRTLFNWLGPLANPARARISCSAWAGPNSWTVWPTPCRVSARATPCWCAAATGWMRSAYRVRRWCARSATARSWRSSGRPRISDSRRVAWKSCA